MSASGKVTAARTSLVLEQPFFGSLALSLKMQADPGCGTAWVDGRTMGYDPAFVDTLSHEQVTALIAHEVMHCAMGHPWRRDGRTFKQWNRACDRAINHELQEAGFKLPADGEFPTGDEAGKSAEWIYARLGDEDGDGKGKGQGQGSPQPGNGPAQPDPLGEVRDAPDGPDADGEPAPTEEDWKQKTASAAQQAKMQGKMPGGMARAVADALKPGIDPRALLLRFVSERAASDYSWAKPNPRYIAHGLYLPALDSKELGEIAIAVDTSGSVDRVGLGIARGVIEAVIDEVSPAAVTVYYFDSRVHSIERFEKGEPLTWKPQGGGGTSFVDVLEQIENAGTAVCTLVITDLEGTFPDDVPTIPVLWLSTTQLIAPFGETVPVER